LIISTAFSNAAPPKGLLDVTEIGAGGGAVDDGGATAGAGAATAGGAGAGAEEDDAGAGGAGADTDAVVLAAADSAGGATYKMEGNSKE